jgi:hypothetical protein
MKPAIARRVSVSLGWTGAIVGAALICFAIWRFTLRVSDIGGMRPSYKVEDYDPFLSEQAKTARNLVFVIERYHVAERAYPADTAALVALLGAGNHAGSSPPESLMKGWRYQRNGDGDGYVLSRMLGWDPTLRFEVDARGRHWVYDPGDGGIERTFLPRGWDQ